MAASSGRCDYYAGYYCLRADYCGDHCAAPYDARLSFVAVALAYYSQDSRDSGGLFDAQFAAACSATLLLVAAAAVDEIVAAPWTVTIVVRSATTGDVATGTALEAQWAFVGAFAGIPWLNLLLSNCLFYHSNPFSNFPNEYPL